MEEKDNMIQDSASIFEEIEVQLETLLSEKKQKIQEDLESKIEKEKKDAEVKITELEEEVTQERDSLQSYRLTLKEFEEDRKKIKVKIKEHLNKAMEYQPQIESLTAKTFDELKIVMDLNKQLEEINNEASSRIQTMKQKLEDKYGITPPVEERVEEDDVLFNLDGELEKLKKIKELLGQNSFEISDNDNEQPTSAQVISPAAEKAEEDEVKEEIPAGPQVEEAIEEAVEEQKVEAAEDVQPTEQEELAPGAEQVEDDGQPPVQEDVQTEESAETEKDDTQSVTTQEAEDKEETEKEEQKEEAVDEDPAATQALMESLEESRKNAENEKDIELSYFESGEKKLLDGQELIDTIAKAVTEADGLFETLTESGSPKEQFFSKQEILWRQETLREYIQTVLGMCEEKQADFPKALDKVFNTKKLKDLQERLTQENWSNSVNFSSFKDYIEELKAEFIDKSTPRHTYLQSVLDELKDG